MGSFAASPISTPSRRGALSAAHPPTRSSYNLRLGFPNGPPARWAAQSSSVRSTSSLGRIARSDREPKCSAATSPSSCARSAVHVTFKDAAGKEHSATIDVMPDYLAIGGDPDFVRVPMTPMTAAHIADAFGCAVANAQDRR